MKGYTSVGSDPCLEPAVGDLALAGAQVLDVLLHVVQALGERGLEMMP